MVDWEAGWWSGWLIGRLVGEVVGWLIWRVLFVQIMTIEDLRYQETESFSFHLCRDFANEIVDVATAHEHKQYIKTLEDIKKFLHS